ncbi:prolyl aminopeptidase [Marivibrio halodurans]|uniref:Proline iminopeptidase n=1 Tax=Marivibrio halodurans TaxID=2039722 RepID=A0A8J7S596_9PROT|nr:prolyl aminopeptidase [Marivibrio halodurans]MBP5859049.1 prolyl aminopeptidase [Marivibrio halodurans]
MPRDRLYPTQDARARGRLAVEPPHEIYWEEGGNPEGVPVCFLHGGPGAGTSPGHRRFFDPSHYRVVLHDQRGAGRSIPSAAVEKNDTQRLIADIEALRRHLGIERWIVFGGSWGSSLALAYAEAHPDRVIALVLRGVFLCRHSEVEWFLHGMGRFFPEAHAAFLGFLPEGERTDPLAAYYRRLIDPDPQVHGPAATAWSRYEAECSTLLPNRDSVQSITRSEVALPLARLEAHYFVNALFLEEGELLAKADRLAGIPGAIVQGRYDVVCPPVSAHDLAAVWPDVRLTLVPDAGHSATEPGIAIGLVNAMERFKTLR